MTIHCGKKIKIDLRDQEEKTNDWTRRVDRISEEGEECLLSGRLHWPIVRPTTTFPDAYGGKLLLLLL